MKFQTTRCQFQSLARSAHLEVDCEPSQSRPAKNYKGSVFCVAACPLLLVCCMARSYVGSLRVPSSLQLPFRSFDVLQIHVPSSLNVFVEAVWQRVNGGKGSERAGPRGVKNNQRWRSFGGVFFLTQTINGTMCLHTIRKCR